MGVPRGVWGATSMLSKLAPLPKPMNSPAGGEFQVSTSVSAGGLRRTKFVAEEGGAERAFRPVE